MKGRKTVAQINDEISTIDREIKYFSKVKGNRLNLLCGRMVKSRFGFKRPCAKARGHRGRHEPLGETVSSNE